VWGLKITIAVVHLSLGSFNIDLHTPSGTFSPDPCSMFYLPYNTKKHLVTIFWWNGIFAISLLDAPCLGCPRPSPRSPPSARHCIAINLEAFNCSISYTTVSCFFFFPSTNSSSVPSSENATQDFHYVCRPALPTMHASN